MKFEWFNVDKESISPNPQNGVYIMKMDTARLLKFGKSSNMLKTKQQYERAGNIDMVCLFYEKIDELESFVLNILSTFRIQKTGCDYLTEVLNINREVLKDIVKWCITNIHIYDIKIPLCRSIKTRENTLMKIDSLISYTESTELCIIIIQKYNVQYYFPMEITYGQTACYSYFLGLQDLYKCIHLVSFS